MTKQDKEEFEEAAYCCICNGKFEEGGKNYKVRDHDHRTGKYRGAAHCKCNINYFSNRYVPVVFHNLKGYDGHQIIREAYNLYPGKDLSVIPNSYEKFMSFKLGQLKFIDSFQFMSSSLEKLVEILYNNNLFDESKYNNDDNYKSYIDSLRSTTEFEYEFEIKQQEFDMKIFKNEFDKKRYETDDKYKTYIDELKKRTMFDGEFDKYKNFPSMKQYCNEHMDILCRK